MPVVSVIIPSYNAAAYVGQAIESVLGQTHPVLETIVVDDGSTDGTGEVLERYGRRIRVIRQPNRGVSVARNTGIADSHGDYVAFLDADDVWEPRKLERQLRALQEEPGAGGCWTARRVVDPALSPIGLERASPGDGDVAALLFRGNGVGTPSSVLLARGPLVAAGGFDPALSQCADWDLWIRVARHTRFHYVDEPLVGYRQHDANMSRGIPLLEADSLRVLHKAFSDPRIPPGLRSRAPRAFARNWMVLAGCYFQAGRYRDFARCATRAIRLDPRQSSYLLRYPARVARRRLAPGN